MRRETDKMTGKGKSRNVAGGGMRDVEGFTEYSFIV